MRIANYEVTLAKCVFIYQDSILRLVEHLSQESRKESKHQPPHVLAIAAKADGMVATAGRAGARHTSQHQQQLGTLSSPSHSCSPVLGHPLPLSRAGFSQKPFPSPAQQGFAQGENLLVVLPEGCSVFNKNNFQWLTL